MERFKSLRSVLFLSKIEDNMNKMYHEEQTRADAAQDWRAQHDKRQGLNRPATPDKEKKKDETEKETTKDTGLTTRVATKIRRMASHGTPTMEKIPESTAHASAPTRRDSTATDTEDDDDGPPLSIPYSSASASEEDEDDDLTRWTSLADPPSGSDASHAASPALLPTDIPTLLQHARRLSIPPLAPAVQFGTRDSHASDESTASDSDDAAVESEDEDADELVRWVSRRDGALAGPVRGALPTTTAAAADRDDDGDVTELNPWTARSPPAQRRGRTAERSGSVSRSRSRVREAKAEMESGTKKGTKKGGLCDADVDELVQWVSRRDSKACVDDDDEVRGRGRGAVV
jgi:hypothetical protein